MSESNQSIVERHTSTREIERDTKSGKWLSKSGDNKRQRRHNNAKHKMERLLLTEVEQRGAQAMRDFAKRSPEAFIKFAWEHLGLSKAKGLAGGPAVSVEVKHYTIDANGIAADRTVIEVLQGDDTPKHGTSAPAELEHLSDAAEDIDGED